MLVFLIIGGCGFVFLVLALLLGELAEHGGELVHDVVAGDSDGDVEHSSGGPSVLSVRFIACFITGFGCGGAIATYLGLGYFLASLIGLGNAILLAGILYAVVSFLYKQQASSNVTSNDLIGKSGTVSIAIPVGGRGEVILNVKGKTIAQFASVVGEPFAVGRVIVVKAVVGDTVIVE